MQIEAETGEGARRVEEYFAGPYKLQWHEVWREGRVANERGESREANPHKLKVWRAVWWYGWDDYNPNFNVSGPWGPISNLFLEATTDPGSLIASVRI